MLRLITSINGGVCARLDSEVGGVLGGLHADATTGQKTQEYSDYEICVNSVKQVYTRHVKEDKLYKVDLPDRAVLMVAGALATLAYSKMDFNLKHVAEDLYATRASMTTIGAELPTKDYIQKQNLLAYESSAFVDYCTRGSKNYSLFLCIGTGMSDTIH